MIRRAAALAIMAGLLALSQGHPLAATGPAGLDPFEGRLSQPIVDPGAEPVRPARPAARENTPIGNPLWAVPLRTLSITRERPIFSPSRRPPPPAVVAAPYASPVVRPPPTPPEPDHPLLTLLGTVAGTTEGFGIFIDDATKSVVRLKIGEGHAGWILQSVRGREVTFEKNKRTATLSLPAPGAEQAGGPALASSAGQPATDGWMDGDGQIIGPPPNLSPPVVAQPSAPALSPATPVGSGAWMDGDGQIIGPPQRNSGSTAQAARP